MNIELKNVKFHPDMSEETNCFSATIYIDGKKTGDVKNSGHGGCHDYYWFDKNAGNQLEQWAKIQPTEFDSGKLDQIIDQELTNYEFARWLKRHTKNKTLFRLKGDKPGAWREIFTPFTNLLAVDAAMLAQLKTKGTLECIANQDLKAAVAFCS